MCGQQVSGVRI